MAEINKYQDTLKQYKTDLKDADITAKVQEIISKKMVSFWYNFISNFRFIASS